MRINIYTKGLATTACRMALVCLLLFAWAGSALAQGSDGQFVIKKGNHYLAHVYNETTHEWELTDATSFSPNCLWYSGRNFNISGTNHNYYFFDGTKFRFLSAPLAPDNTLSLSETLPDTYLLNNSDQNYYFYDWDSDTYGPGLSRGHKHTEATNSTECALCGGSWYTPKSECWEVYWVEYDNGVTGTWKLSSASSYNITENAGRNRPVTITPHSMEITNPIGGLASLTCPTEMVWGGSSASLSATVSNYTYTFTPAYITYEFEGGTHNYFDDGQGGGPSDHLTSLPDSQTSSNNSATSYHWELSDEDGYLTLTHPDPTSPAATLAYTSQNPQGHKTDTLTLTVTYSDGSTQQMQAYVVVRTPCQNPAQASTPVVTYEGATVSWYGTSDSYIVYWKKTSATDWTSAPVGDVTSFTITGLDYDADYEYKVKADCTPETGAPSVYTFHTNSQPNALVYGAVFGGGRMGNVVGNTEVVIINCEDISAVYGGNDIAGEVQGDEGSTIILGVADANDPYGNIGTTVSSIGVNVGSVYGGGNGYYAYNGTNFEAATTQDGVVPAGASVMALSENGWDTPVWTNPNTTSDSILTIPTIAKTAITVAASDHVKVDSLFGGAKNAFLTTDNGNGSTIIVKGGTIFAVFGGNNFGGTQGNGKHHIEVQGTKTNTSATMGYGSDFGIGYVFGGGNKVYGSATEIIITGGQCDTVFAGGNAASVAGAYAKVDCTIDAASSTNANTFGNVYSQAITSYSGENLTIDGSYLWNGTGVYNVRALFGGNNRADMTILPTIELVSGSVGTVYGGGNAGDMKASEEGISIANDFDPPMLNSVAQTIYYGTHVKMNSPTILVDNLYGGCQMSNVDYSTWVEVEDGHVGYVFGGCNISGDVGSMPRLDYYDNMPGEEYQLVKGGTYVKVSGGTIHKNLYAGSNGYYHCNDGVNYIGGGVINLGHYVGMPIPTHNETHVKVTDGTINGDVYAGGNMAPVGFINETSLGYTYRTFVGFASVRLSDGLVVGNVYGGGNMASIYGSNEVRISGGRIDGALYGGNDQCGMVAQITNRVLPAEYDKASDGQTSLTAMDVHSYISLTGKPQINTVYGGGNGDYNYTSDNYCNPNDKPIQSNTFVDINIDASGGDGVGGHINTVYGGGNGVTVTGGITVFLNVEEAGENVYDHVGTIFGANNIGVIDDLVPDIILLNGRVNTVYGGGNHGALNFHKNLTLGGETYNDVGSYVYVGKQYRPNGTGTAVNTNVKVSGNIFGGCNQNGVGYNTLVLVEDGEHTATLFGGSNTSGIVGGNSQVVVLDGTVGEVYGGGQGQGTGVSGNVTVVIGSESGTPTVNGDVYGGSALGSVNTNTANLTKVWLKNGTITGSVYGGGLGDQDAGIAAVVMGNVQVINDAADATAIYGCNNENGAPEGTVAVTVNGGIIGSVFGGGNMAAYTAPSGNLDYPSITVTGGTVSHKVVGGGNAADVTGNPNITISGGTFATTGDFRGIYGGCNTTGTVTGNTTITITGDATHHTTIGASGVGNQGRIFGGGYGQATTVTGNVLINFGVDDNIQSDYPLLVGDLYGGSALGRVNTATSAESPYNTTINVYNGTITGPFVSSPHPEQNTYGNIFGGGLGNLSVPALVHGKVYVNIGKSSNPPSGSLSGKANLVNCNVYGCNNENGSPQDDVFVNVYQTAHEQGINTVDDKDFAILQVFGGGNHAHYAPENGLETSEKKTHVYIHGCENTVKYVYGGGNAADAVGVVTLVGGGHFNEVFGGGNGAVAAANIGKGGIGLNVMAGRISYLYAGSNKQGVCLGSNYEANPDILGLTGFIDCGELIVESFFFGDNEAEHYGDIVHTIECAEASDFHYSRLYGGSRWAIVYGDIKLTVCGGIIEQLFGGSMGYAINQTPAHVRRFPTYDEIDANPTKYSQQLKNFLGYPDNHYHDELIGKGGNIELVVTGGTIGEVIGGCDEFGNVEGKITVVIDDAGETLCPLQIGNIYGASNLTYYEPWDDGNNGVYYEPTGTHADEAIPTPQVIVIKSSNTTGFEYDFNQNGSIGPSEIFEGSVYGGANQGDVTSNPRVIVGDGTSTTPVNIGGNVYGGGNEGNVIGSPQVVIVPQMHELTFSNSITGGSIAVSYPRGDAVASGDDVGEGIALRVVATPSPATQVGSAWKGYLFRSWSISPDNTGASVGTSANTLFIMGNDNVTLSASFDEVDAYELALSSADGTGTFTVTLDGVALSSPYHIPQGATVTVQVTPGNDYAFDHWSFSGSGSSVSSQTLATTNFTMGSANATLTAHFKTAHQLTLVEHETGWGTFKVNGVATTSGRLAEDEIATIVAIPKQPIETGGVWKGYLFHDWSITSGGNGATLSSTTSASISFKMGTEATTLKATFNEVPAHQLTMSVEGGTGGSFKVNGENYTAPVWVAQGASVPIVAVSAYGYRFKRWISTEANGTIGDLNAAYTVFIMGAGDTHTVKAEFEAIATHTFTFAAAPTEGGTITVTDSDGNPVNSNDQIREGAVLTITATAASGYSFTEWAATNGTIGNASLFSTTFTMGTGNATLTATFTATAPSPAP